MTQPQIKPCFNCGSDRIDIIESIEEREPLERQYYCIVCKVAGPIGYSDDEALERWNALPRHSNPQVAAGLRDAIRLALAEDDPEYYPVSVDQETGLPEMSNEAIDRCADIAYATIVNQQPIEAAQGGQPKSMLWTEMSRVADKLNALKYWGLTHWEFTGDRFENLQSGGGEGWAQSSIENACAAVNEGAQGGKLASN